MGSALTIFSFFLFFRGYGLGRPTAAGLQFFNFVVFQRLRPRPGHFWHVDEHRERAYNVSVICFLKVTALAGPLLARRRTWGAGLQFFSFSVFQRLRPWPGHFWHIDGHGERAYSFRFFCFSEVTALAGLLLARRRTWGAGL